MPPPKGDAQRRRVVDKLRAPDVLGCVAPLHPRDHAHQHVILDVTRRVPNRRLPDLPRAGTTAAMAHTADPEEAVESVQLG